MVFHSDGAELADPLLDRLEAIPYTGALSDILDELGFRSQVLPQEIQSIQPGQAFAGKAFTVTGEPTDSLDPEIIFIPFLRMLGDVGEGDVIVSQPNDHDCAHLGELSAETAQFRGARAAVIDGGIRDVAYILRIGFPVFARYRTPADIVGRWRLLDYNIPIQIGATEINPGDYVVGDMDGVVVIPRDAAEEVITKAEQVVDMEDEIREHILRGMLPLEAYRRYGRF